VAINYFEMFATLKLGIDIEPTTPPASVPHVFQPGYVPTYTVRNDAGETVFKGDDVHQLVEEAHWDMEALTLYEDEYPVFTVN
jgi:hypothetical protein